MTIQEIYGQCTAEGCRNALSQYASMDDNITIGELKTFLREREAEAKSDLQSGANELIKKLTGRSFRLKFSDDHVALLKIDSIEVEQKYGFIDAIMKGEEVSSFKGNLSHEVLKDQKWFNYSHEGVEEIEITNEEFDSVKKSLKSLKNCLFSL